MSSSSASFWNLGTITGTMKSSTRHLFSVTSCGHGAWSYNDRCGLNNYGLCKKISDYSVNTVLVLCLSQPGMIMRASFTVKKEE